MSEATRAGTPRRALDVRRLPAGWRTLLGGVAAVALVMLVRPPSAPPLYDGIGAPDEPYRWLVAPAGAPRTPTVTVARGQAAVSSAGTNNAVRAFSLEQGPQIAFDVRAGTLVSPAKSTTVVVQAEAVEPPDVLPDAGELTSNVYAVTATANVEGEVTLADSAQLVINLRAERVTQNPVVMSAFDGEAWTPVKTTRVGTEIYAGALPALGRVALVKLPAGAGGGLAAAGPPVVATPSVGADTPRSLSNSPDVSNSALWFALAGFVVLLGIGLLLARLRARGAREA